MLLRKLLLFLLLNFMIINVEAGRPPRVDWYTHSYVLHQYLHLNKGILEEHYLFNKLSEYINKKMPLSSYYETLSMFILLSRVDLEKSLEISNIIINKVPKNNKLYQLAVQLLAKNGETEKLRKIMHKPYDFSNLLTIAESGDFTVINDFLIKKINEILQYPVSSIAVLMNDESPYLNKITQKIIVDFKTLNKNHYLYAFNLIVNFENIRSTAVIKEANQSLLYMLEGSNRGFIKFSLKMSINFGYLGLLSEAVKSKIIEMSIKHNNTLIKIEARKTSKTLGLINVSNNDIDSQDLSISQPIKVTDSFLSMRLSQYLLKLKYTKLWMFYANQLNHVEIIDMLNEMVITKNINDEFDIDQKLSYVIDLDIYKNSNSMFKIKILEFLSILQYKLTDKILKQLYQDGSIIEKSFLLGQYPKFIQIDSLYIGSNLENIDNWIRIGIWHNIYSYYGVKFISFKSLPSKKSDVLKHLQKLEDLGNLMKR